VVHDTADVFERFCPAIESDIVPLRAVALSGVRVDIEAVCANALVQARNRAIGR
jgi:hypothetical protein